MNISKKKFIKFTLIEMLVVIAIIGILASMMMPALNSAISASRGIACSNNLKQLSVASIMYSDEHIGYIPSAQLPSGSWLERIWHTKFMPYIDNSMTSSSNVIYMPVFLCPENPQGTAYSYGMNVFNIYSQVSEPVRLSSIKTNFSKTMYIQDCGSPSRWFIPNNDWSDAQPALRHNSLDAVLFLDGHIKLVDSFQFSRDLVLQE